MGDQASVSGKPPSRVNLYGVNTIGKHISQAFFTAALLFLGAGSMQWVWGWVCVGVYTLCWAGLSLALAIYNPELLNRRGQRVKRATLGTKGWDLVLLSIYFVIILLQPLIAGFDWRYSWSPAVSPLAYIVGNILLSIGFIPLTWAMIANRNFEPTVRIQEKDFHRVATSGPYRIVRHPGYAGLVIQLLAFPLAVGCWTAFVPGVIGVVVFIIRTYLEDRTLQKELPGYTEYAEHTRYRLIPGVW